MVGWTRALAPDLNPEDELLSPSAPYSQHASLLTPLAAFYFAPDSSLPVWIPAGHHQWVVVVTLEDLT